MPTHTQPQASAPESSAKPAQPSEEASRSGPDTTAKPAREGTLFHLLLDRGWGPELAYTANQRIHAMTSEIVAATLEPLMAELRQMRETMAGFATKAELAGGNPADTREHGHQSGSGGARDAAHQVDVRGDAGADGGHRRNRCRRRAPPEVAASARPWCGARTRLVRGWGRWHRRLGTPASAGKAARRAASGSSLSRVHWRAQLRNPDE